MFDDDRRSKELAFGRALRVGHETNDPNLTFAASAYLGASMVHDDRTEEGMVLLDEALAAVVGGEEFCNAHGLSTEWLMNRMGSNP